MNNNARSGFTAENRRAHTVPFKELKFTPTSSSGDSFLSRVVSPFEKLVEIEDERLGGKFNVTMVGEEVGDFDSCNRVVELVMAKDA